MKKNNQNGFTLILSLVMLLVMSLMGGALIVISSGDHQSIILVININKLFMLPNMP